VILDLIWAGGEVLSIVALPSGEFVRQEIFCSPSAVTKRRTVERSVHHTENSRIT
jgi:hypothetical protein